MSFTNKTVIVTGGSSGIGASIAIHFAKQGADVAIVGRNEEKLANTAEICTKAGKKPLVIKADVSKEEDAKQIVKKTVDKYGKIDVLVNNAGIVAMAKVTDENLISIHDSIINTNLRSVVMLTNLSAQYLIKTKGNIVNISGIAGCGTLADLGFAFASCCTAKAGLNHFSRVCAVELGAHGVRVNIVSPGPVDTPHLESDGGSSGWDSYDLKKVTALGKVTQPEEVADLVAYLASDKAKSITGANYVIDAGYLVK